MLVLRNLKRWHWNFKKYNVPLHCKNIETKKDKSLGCVWGDGGCAPHGILELQFKLYLNNFLVISGEVGHLKMLLPKAPKLGMHWNGRGSRLVLAF